jgi:hypothetical protein
MCPASSPTATMTQRTTTINPPPGRRAPAQVVQTTQVQVNSSQATAVYDYSSPDSGDLSVQAGQVVNVIEKTSDDCVSLSWSLILAMRLMI